MRINVRLKDYGMDTVRYAAYALTDDAYALITATADSASVELTPKAGKKGGGLKKRFERELEDEKLRASICESNRELREWLLLKAISPREAAPNQETSTGLTAEQERELDALIKQVEVELASEATASRDPLGITKTWEEKHGAKTARKK